MNNKSRENILSAVKRNQPPAEDLVLVEQLPAIRYDDVEAEFIRTLRSIGGTCHPVTGVAGISSALTGNFETGGRWVTTVPGLPAIPRADPLADPHGLENIEVAIVEGDFGVAENGTVWIKEASLAIRILPFICQHLVLVLPRQQLLHNMHEAYDRIGSAEYGFGLFIAGPSKTADIEQSLVLGAHGARTMTVLLLDQ